MPEIRIGFGGQVESSLRSSIEEVRHSATSLGEDINGMFEHVTGQSMFESMLDSLKDKLMELALGPLASFVVGIGAVDTALWLMDKATENVTEGLKEFSTMEDLEGAFRTLLGGAAQAKDRLAELATFAADTPFNLPEVAAASRTLEVLTHGALSTGDGLRLVGDIAAQTGAPLQEMAMWVGRLYDNLQSGRPIGEAMARLQELGTVSGTARAKIEEMQKAGTAGNEVWKVAKAELDRAKGSMDVLSETLTGLQSTLQDTKAALMREVGKSFVDQEKTAIKGATQALTEMTPLAEHAAEVLADFSIGDSPTEWFPVFDAQIKSVINTVLSAKDALKGLIDGVAVAGAGLVAGIGATALVTLGAFLLKIRSGASIVGMMISAAQAHVMATRAEVVAIGAATKAEADRLIVQGLSTRAAYVQAAASVGLRTAIRSVTASILEMSAALLLNPVAMTVAAIGALSAGLYLWSQRAGRALEAQQLLAKEAIRGTGDIQSVSDKINRLADAYKKLADARAALAKTPPGSVERTNAENKVKALEVEAGQVERLDDTKLKPSDDRKKIDDDKQKLQMEEYEKALDPIKALELAQARLNEELVNNRVLTIKAAEAEFAANQENLDAIKAQIRAKEVLQGLAQARMETIDREQRDAVEQGDDSKANALEAERTALLEQIEPLGAEIDRLSKSKEGLTSASEQAKTAKAKSDLRVTQARSGGIPDDDGKVPAGRVGVDEATKNASAYKLKLAEAEAEQKIAQLQSEGIKRAREEYEIRQRLVELQWRAANLLGDTEKSADAKKRWLENERKIKEQEEVERKANNQRDAETKDAQIGRVENFRKRVRDAALAQGQMTPEAHRQEEMDALARRRERANEEARDLEAQAKAAHGRGAEAEGDKLDLRAIERRKEADTAGFDLADLSRKPFGRPVADNLAKLGLGGNVGAADPGRMLGSKLDQQLQVQRLTLEALNQIKDRSGGRAGPGYFPR